MTKEKSASPKSSVRIFRPTNCPDVEIWDVRNTNDGCTFFHDTYTVCTLLNITDNGVADWRYRKKRHYSSARSLMMMEPGEMHITDNVSGQGTYFVARITPSVFANLSREVRLPSTPHLKTQTWSDAQGMRLFMGFHRSIDEGAVGGFRASACWQW